MGIDEVIISFLRKEPLCRGIVRSNGNKLFVDKTCIGQWCNHRVILNDSEYNAKVKKVQDMAYKILEKSDLIFRTVSNVPEGKQQIISYYNED